MSQYFSKDPPLKSLPNFRSPSKIHKLEYAHNSITKIDSYISKAVNIQYIDLSHNLISKIQHVFGFKRLRVLNVSHNHISDVGKGICSLTGLQELDLGHNLISRLKSIVHVGQLFQTLNGRINVNLQGNEVLIKQGKKVMQMFMLPPHNQKIYPQTCLDVSLPFSKEFQTKLNSTFKTRIKLANTSFSRSEELNCRKALTHQIDLFAAQNKIEANLHPANQLLEPRILESESKLQQIQGRIRTLEGIDELSKNTVIGPKYAIICQSAYNCITIYRELLQQCKQVNIEQFVPCYQKSMIQITEQQELIKDQHQQILGQLEQSPEIPMKFYAAWVHTYRTLRETAQSIIIDIKSLVTNHIRSREISKIAVISPQKDEHSDRLAILLFSAKNNPGDNLEGRECSECIIRSQKLNKLQKQCQSLKIANCRLEQKFQTVSTENRALKQANRHLVLRMESQQKKVVEQLEKGEPSTYQNLLLSQAKGLELFLKYSLFDINGKHSNKTRQSPCQKGSMMNTQCRSNHSHNPVTQKIVSEFVCNSSKRDSSGTSNKLPYFNTKEQSRSRGKSRQEQSHKNTEVESNQPSIANQPSKLTFSDPDQNPSNPQHSSKQQTTQELKHNEASAINRNSVLLQKTEATKQTQNQCRITEFVLTQLENPSKHSSIHKQNLPIHSMGINELNEKVKKHVPTDYKAIELRNNKSYTDYMKYHLRNSIIDVLSKKGHRPSLEKKYKSNNNFWGIVPQHPSGTTSKHRRNSETKLGRGTASRPTSRPTSRPISRPISEEKERTTVR